MKDFIWTEFTRKITVKGNLQTIYNAWTIPSEIESWFLSRARFSRDDRPVSMSDSVMKGDSYEWSWFLFDVVEKGTVLAANGIDFISFTFAGRCIVEVQLSQQDDNVLVTLTQRNIPTDDASKQNIRLGCDSGWSFYQVNLKSVYEGGLDLRNKNEQFKGMVNN